MNFTLSGTRLPRKKKLADEQFDVQRAEDEDEGAKPRPKTLTAVRGAADLLAQELGGTCHVEVHGHETLDAGGDDDFKPGHLTVTVSRLHPEASR